MLKTFLEKFHYMNGKLIIGTVCLWYKRWNILIPSGGFPNLQAGFGIYTQVCIQKKQDYRWWTRSIIWRECQCKSRQFCSSSYQLGKAGTDGLDVRSLFLIGLVGWLLRIAGRLGLLSMLARLDIYCFGVCSGEVRIYVGWCGKVGRKWIYN